MGIFIIKSIPYLIIGYGAWKLNYMIGSFFLDDFFD